MTTTTALLLLLIERVGLIIAVAFFLLMLTPFQRVGRRQDQNLPVRTILILLFGAFGIMGTYSGDIVLESVANLRAMSVITAGLFGGPLVGAGAGAIAGGHRILIDIGGFSSLPCGLATFLEGVLAGCIARRWPHLRLDWRLAFWLTVVAECAHMGLVLLLSKPWTEAWALVEVIALPMITINSLGAVLFVQIIALLSRYNEKRDSNQAQTILDIANRTVGHLRSGLNTNSAQATAEILFQRIEAAAVAVTDRYQVLAHIGAGDDHHLPGEPLRTTATRDVLRDGNPVMLTRASDIGCMVNGCPFHSAIVVPLQKNGEVVGTIKLYGDRRHNLDRVRFELVKGLGELFSTQLELEDIQITSQLLAQNEIQRLQAQINPHFLFNALNTIASFCRTNADRARDLLLDLSTFMRRNLTTQSAMVPLGEEFEHIDSYLSIVRARFGDRVLVEKEIQTPCLKWPVPPLLIQPLLENAVQYGAAQKPEGGRVRLVARMRQEWVEIVVEDDGPGMDPRTIKRVLSGANAEAVQGNRTGIGAVNCQKRLLHLYGPEWGLQIESATGRGTRIRVCLPRPPLSSEDMTFASRWEQEKEESESGSRNSFLSE